MASAEREPITGVWGQSPSGVQGQSLWSVGHGGDWRVKLQTWVKVSDTPGAGNHFYHLKMAANIIKDINMKK